LDGIDCFLVTDLSKIRNVLNSVKQVLLDGKPVSSSNQSIVSGFYFSCLVPIIIIIIITLAVSVGTNTKDTHALVSSDF